MGARRDRQAASGSGKNQSDLFSDPTAEPEPSGTRALPPALRIGTSGYSFTDWVGPFYPPGTPRGRCSGWARPGT